MKDAVHVRIQRHHEAATLPRVSQDGDVAADLFACEATEVPARGRALVPTGIALELPDGFRARIHARSGLSWKHGIETGAGLIDHGFRDPLGVLLYNHTDAPYAVQVGDRIAQLCIERYTHPTFEEVEAIAPTGRSAGWGSSGR